jgi:hypothetical protein
MALTKAPQPLGFRSSFGQRDPAQVAPGSKRASASAVRITVLILPEPVAEVVLNGVQPQVTRRLSALLAETRSVCASILCHEEGSFQGFLESAQPDRDPLPHPKARLMHLALASEKKPR